MSASECTESRIAAKPAWGWLYGVLAALASVFTMVEVAVPDGPARRCLEAFVAVVMLGIIVIWVRANRVALALTNEHVPSRPAPVTSVTAHATSKRAG